MYGDLRLVAGQSVLANNIVCVATAEPGLLLSRTSETGAIYWNQMLIYVNQN